MSIKQSLFRTVTVAVAVTTLVLSGASAEAATPTTGQVSAHAATQVAASTESAKPDLTFGGSNILSYWIDFNSTDQTAMIAGETALMVALICVIAPEACAISGIVAPIAETYLQKYGKCPHSETLRAYYQLTTLTHARCLK